MGTVAVLFAVLVLGFAAASQGSGRVLPTAPIALVSAGATASVALGEPALEATPQIRMASRYGAWVRRVQPGMELLNAAEPQVRTPWRRRPTGGATP